MTEPQHSTEQDDRHNQLHKGVVQLERAEQSLADQLAAFEQRNAGADLKGVHSAARDLNAAVSALMAAQQAFSAEAPGRAGGGGGTPVAHDLGTPVPDQASAAGGTQAAGEGADSGEQQPA